MTPYTHCKLQNPVFLWASVLGGDVDPGFIPLVPSMRSSVNQLINFGPLFDSDVPELVTLEVRLDCREARKGFFT